VLILNVSGSKRNEASGPTVTVSAGDGSGDDVGEGVSVAVGEGVSVAVGEGVSVLP
jgi:hypothetical protein